MQFDKRSRSEFLLLTQPPDVPTDPRTSPRVLVFSFVVSSDTRLLGKAWREGLGLRTNPRPAETEWFFSFVGPFIFLGSLTHFSVVRSRLWKEPFVPNVKRQSAKCFGRHADGDGPGLPRSEERRRPVDRRPPGGRERNRTLSNEGLNVPTVRQILHKGPTHKYFLEGSFIPLEQLPPSLQSHEDC